MDNFLLLPRVLAGALFDLSFAAGWGLLLVSLWIGDAPALRARLRRGALACALGMLMALSAQGWLLTATMANSKDIGVIRAQLGDVLMSTHAGRVLLLNVAAALLLLAMLLMYRGTTHARAVARLGAIIVLAMTRAAAGHAASDGDFTLAELVQFIHLGSVATWSGSIIASGLLVLPRLLREGGSDVTTRFMRRLSAVVSIALGFVVLSGIYNSYRGLGGSLQPLARTGWGGLLDAKIALVCIALAMGWHNRRRLAGEGMLSPADTSRLSLVLRAEAVVMLLILAVSAWLANTAPPASL